MSSLDEYRYEYLTWPEINEAAEAEKVVLLPIGSTEQHGHHLPLDVDNFLATSMCLEAAKKAPRELLVMPNIPYGYNEHAQDFPGTIHVTYEHFIEYCLDVCKSVAYAGFKRIMIVDGHGSNEHLCEFIARRATLETDALFATTIWTNLITKEFEEVRDSEMGGAAHACELETSAYLYLEPSRVRMDKAEDHYGGAAGSEGSKYLYVDLGKGWGPVKIVKWTSSSTPNGVSGAPTLATAEKGKALVESCSDHIVAFCQEFKAMPDPIRVDHRTVKPDIPKLPNLD
ncbi:TPA: creatininase [Candidatus Latescibacteria bacterium]|nr:creatininase [Candidatus Latescibacterota bacterium]|tara:strand:- start:7 stop:861 length:855 start_codon:yes stop_codon:yes gene_type:complete